MCLRLFNYETSKHNLMIVCVVYFENIFIRVLDGIVDLGRQSQEYESRTTNLTDRQYVVLPLIIAVLFGVASLIWITMVAVLPGAWNFHNLFNYNGRAFPSDVSSIPTIIHELESYFL